MRGEAGRIAARPTNKDGVRGGRVGLEGAERQCGKRKETDTKTRKKAPMKAATGASKGSRRHWRQPRQAQETWPSGLVAATQTNKKGIRAGRAGGCGATRRQAGREVKEKTNKNALNAVTEANLGIRRH
jgi:hypothetical protein